MPLERIHKLAFKAAEASHCAVGTDWTAPRTISEMFAMIGRQSPKTAFIQSGTGITRSPTTISKGKVSMTMNSRTSHGELRKTCVSAQQILRILGDGEI